MQPHFSQRALRFGASCVHSQHTLPALYGEFDLPATTGQRHDRLGREPRGRQRAKHQDPPCQKQGRRFRRACCVALAALLPGAIGLLRAQALGMHPAPDLVDP
jgi:hypothetical protein